MLSIWKYPLEITDEQDIEMPAAAKILSVQFQHGGLCLWAQVCPSDLPVSRKIIIHGTGHEFRNDQVLEYIATVQMYDGKLVWHIYEAKP